MCPELHECHRVCDCLQHFTAVETLGHSNAYFCDTCKRKSTATKQLTIHTLPNILVIQLKRFSFAGSLGGKISRHIAFETELDMGKFLSRRAGAGETDNMYDLYGVLVHKGSSAQCGIRACTHASARCLEKDATEHFPFLANPNSRLPRGGLAPSPACRDPACAVAPSRGRVVRALEPTRVPTKAHANFLYRTLLLVCQVQGWQMV